MRRMDWRRAKNLGLALVIAMAGIGAQSTPAAAPVGGTLLGVAACMFCPQSLDRIDPASGSETPVAGVAQFPFIHSLVADPSAQLLYGTSPYGGGGRGGAPPQWELVTIDLKSGTVSINQGITASELAIDPHTRALFGLADNITGQTISTSVSRIDPTSGTMTAIATLPFFPGFRRLVVDSATHTLFTQSATGGLYAIDVATGSVTTIQLQSPVLFVAYDSVTGGLFGVLNNAQLVKLNPTNGAETPVGNFSAAGFPTGAAIDSTGHTVYLVLSELGLGGEQETRIGTVDDLTGAGAVSALTAFPVAAIAFQPAPITPDSIKADVEGALSSGAIDNGGVANSLLAKLAAAEDARTRGDCGTPANIYQAFINEANAQSGRHLQAATAAQLISEAKFLIANCP